MRFAHLWLAVFGAMAALAQADGSSPAAATPIKLFGAAELRNGEKQVVKFSAAKVPQGREAVLVFHARMDFPTPAGYNPGMQVRCNGVELDGNRLLGRPLRWADPQGRINLTTAHLSFNVHYAPDFSSADKSFYAIPGCKACEFQLRVGDCACRAARLLHLPQ